MLTKKCATLLFATKHENDFPADDTFDRRRTMITTRAGDQNLYGSANAAAAILGVPVIAVAFFSRNSCVFVLQLPLISIGIFISFWGMVGFLGRSSRLLVLLSSVTLLVSIMALGSAVYFVFGLAVNGHGHRVIGGNFTEYYYREFAGLIPDMLSDAVKWDESRRCVQSKGVCPKFNLSRTSLPRLLAADIPPLESGCCKPPVECGLEFVRGSCWSGSSNVTMNRDCGRWNNDASTLCYDCGSCKGGLLYVLREDWRFVGYVLLFDALSLLVIFLLCLGKLLHDQDYSETDNGDGEEATGGGRKENEDMRVFSSIPKFKHICSEHTIKRKGV